MSETATVTFTLVGTERVRDKGKLIGLANVEVEWGGIAFTLQGITVVRESDGSISCLAPRFRHPGGRWLPGVVLPPTLIKAIGNEVLQAFK